MKFRIVKFNKGFVVQVQKRTWLRKKYKHFIGIAGIPSMPWYFRSYENAEKELLDNIKTGTYLNSII